MRIALALLLLLHGGAHVAGFLSPWGISALRGRVALTPSSVILGGRLQLGTIAARALGIVWLLVGLAFLGTAFGVLRQSSWWIAAVLTLSVLSLVMTIVWWPATRFGAAVNVMVLSGIMAVGVGQFRDDLRQARARVSTSSVMQTSAGAIEYATAGEGIPVLALHGTAGGWDQSLTAGIGLTRFGYRLIAPSRFGYLRTPWRADASPAVEADAWVTLLDSLRIDRVAVMSWSAGAAPAVQLALRHPERVSKLVFFVPGAGGIMPPSDPVPIWVVSATFKWNFPIWAMRRVSRDVMLSWVAVPASLVPTLAPADVNDLENAIDRLFPVSARHDGMVYDARSQSGEFGVFPIERIAVPTLWVSAEDDMYRTLRVAKHAAGVIPGATLLKYETGGHLLLGRSEDYWPRIDRFLRDSL